jgi:hypothetical protein
MTIKELYDLLCDKSFQEPATGYLFFPAYMYLYEPENEYLIREEIASMKDRLVRPTDFVDVLDLNIFNEFCNYLKTQKWGSTNWLHFILSEEAQNYQSVQRTLRQKANDNKFCTFLNNKIQLHINEVSDLKKSYVFIYGFGQIFPYLRASKFMNLFEQYIKGYKIILFYPGNADKNYNLFKVLNDEHLYRAIKLINQ